MVLDFVVVKNENGEEPVVLRCSEGGNTRKCSGLCVNRVGNREC